MMTLRHPGSARLRRVLAGFTLMVAVLGISVPAALAAAPAGGQVPAFQVDNWGRDLLASKAPVTFYVDDWGRPAPDRFFVDDWGRRATPVAAPVAVPVAVPQTGGGFDWVDAFIGAAVALGIAAVAVLGVRWTTHHWPRHPRGPAVPVS